MSAVENEYLMDDRALFADLRYRAVRLALVASWAVLAAIVLFAIRDELFTHPRIWGSVAGSAIGLIALVAIPWREVLTGPAGDLLLLLWTALTIVLLALVSSVGDLAHTTFFLYFAVVAFSAVWFSTVTHAAVAVGAAIAHLASTVLGERELILETLSLEMLTLGVVAGLTGMVAEDYRRQRRRGHDQVEELQRREADLERLYEVSRTVSAGENLAGVLPELVGKIARYLKARVGVVLLYRPSHHALEVISPIWVAGKPLRTDDYRLPLVRGGTVERVFMKRTPVLSNMLSEDPEVQDTLLDDLGIESIMAVPLRVETRTMGVLLVADKEGEPFTEADMEALESLAAPAALVLDQLARYQEAEDTSRRMEELAQLKTHFVSVVSHELRTPLTSIIGALATLSRPELPAGSPTAKELLASARKQADRLRAMIEDLLMVSRIDARALPQNPERVDLDSLVRDTIQGIPDPDERVSIVAIESDRPVEVDPEHLRRIIANLVSNALKYAPGSPVEISVKRAGDEVWFQVVDHGPGVPEDHREAVFERFTQLGPAQTREHGGTGLGLSIVRSLTEAMGGRVWLEETPGGGATFTVALPRSPGAVQRMAAQS